MGFLLLALCCIRKKLYFLGRILTLPEVPKVVLDILKLRLNMLNVDSDSNSIGFLSEILHSLETYDLMPYLHLWQRVSIFPSYRKWKHNVNSRIFSHERADILTASEASYRLVDRLDKTLDEIACLKS